MAEPITLEVARDACKRLDNDRDAAIEAMIPRAREWVENFTGLALVQRQITKPHTVWNGYIRPFYGPFVSLDGIGYTDSAGTDQTYEARWDATRQVIRPALGGSWPSADGFLVTYTAGYADGEVPDSLIGAMLALIVGEHDAGVAYPREAVEAAERCCGQLRMSVL